MPQKSRLRVLVVDDAPENIHILMEILKDSYSLQAAVNGERALQLARSEPTPDIILLDVMMPGIDGYEVCRRLKMDSRTKAIPVIFITAKVETADIVSGFEAGGVDYVTKPFNTLELTARINTHLELKNSRDKINKFNKRLKEELLLAGKLQRELLPPDIDAPVIKIRSIYEPYQIVSGDFFNYAWNNEGTAMRGYIMDLTGHGTATALQISALNVLMLEAMEKAMPAESMLRWVNDKACDYFHDEYFAAVLYFDFDFKNMSMSYVPAGINYLLASSDDLKGVIQTTSSLIGVEKAQWFEQYKISLRPGDTFYFLSDGLSELLGEEITLNLSDYDDTVSKLKTAAQDCNRWDDASAVCIKIDKCL